MKMTRISPNQRGRTKSEPHRRRAAHAPPSPVTALDPEVEKAILRMLRGFLLRTGATFLIVAFISTFLPGFLRIPQNGTIVIVFMSAFGVMIPYWRGLNRLFQEVLRLGQEKIRQRRYADARHALEYFHKLGNRGFDQDGAAHYYLTLAYLGLNEFEKAQAMVTWLTRYRKPFPWHEKAAAALAEAQSRRQSSNKGFGTENTPELM